MNECATPEVVREVAEALRCVSKDLRSAGDISVVELSEDGVTLTAATLADELWLYALRLDGRTSNDEPAASPDPEPTP